MNPAVKSIQGNLITLARRPELQRQAEADAAVQRALVQAIRARPSREVETQYPVSDKVARRGLWLLGLLALAASVLSGGPG